MIIIRVELHSAITHKATELARMIIANDGTEQNPRKGNYNVAVLRGRNKEALDKSMLKYLGGGEPFKKIHVKNWPRTALHVWNLVQVALTTLDYGHGKFAGGPLLASDGSVPELNPASSDANEGE